MTTKNDKSRRVRGLVGAVLAVTGVMGLGLGGPAVHGVPNQYQAASGIANNGRIAVFVTGATLGNTIVAAGTGSQTQVGVNRAMITRAGDILHQPDMNTVVVLPVNGAPRTVAAPAGCDGGNFVLTWARTARSFGGFVACGPSGIQPGFWQWAPTTGVAITYVQPNEWFWPTGSDGTGITGRLTRGPEMFAAVWRNGSFELLASGGTNAGVDHVVGLNHYIGYRIQASGYGIPVRWLNGVATDLMVPAGKFGAVLGVNAGGDAVGYVFDNVTWRLSSYVWRADGSVFDLGALLPGEYSVASGINSFGSIVGNSAPVGSEQEAYIWTPKSGVVRIGDMSAPKATCWMRNGSRSNC